MKVINLEDATLEDCARLDRGQQVVITRKNKPIALIVGLKGMDLEQVELSFSSKFWNKVKEWRGQPTISHEELLKELAEGDQQHSKPTRKKQKTS